MCLLLFAKSYRKSPVYYFHVIRILNSRSLGVCLWFTYIQRESNNPKKENKAWLDRYRKQEKCKTELLFTLYTLPKKQKSLRDKRHCLYEKRI